MDDIEAKQCCLHTHHTQSQSLGPLATERARLLVAKGSSLIGLSAAIISVAGAKRAACTNVVTVHIKPVLVARVYIPMSSAEYAGTMQAGWCIMHSGCMIGALTGTAGLQLHAAGTRPYVIGMFRRMALW